MDRQRGHAAGDGGRPGSEGANSSIVEYDQEHAPGPRDCTDSLNGVADLADFLALLVA
jgi:hypothetical protein